MSVGGSLPIPMTLSKSQSLAQLITICSVIATPWPVIKSIFKLLSNSLYYLHQLVPFCRFRSCGHESRECDKCVTPWRLHGCLTSSGRSLLSAERSRFSLPYWRAWNRVCCIWKNSLPLYFCSVENAYEAQPNSLTFCLRVFCLELLAAVSQKTMVILRTRWGSSMVRIDHELNIQPDWSLRGECSC